MDISTEPCPGQLRQHSYAVVRGLFDAATTERLREICERVLEQWRRAPRCDNPPVGPQANYMRHLNDPEYHRDHPDDLAFLLNAMGSPQVVESLSAALDEEFLFALSSLYFNPTGESQDGFWHKDKIGAEADVSRRPETGAGLQMQIALVPTDDLEVVPGSHLRDYSPKSTRSASPMMGSTTARTICQAPFVSTRNPVTRCCLPSCAFIGAAITPTSSGAR